MEVQTAKNPTDPAVAELPHLVPFEPSSIVLTPPYSGTYEQVAADPNLFRWRLVKKPEAGAVSITLADKSFITGPFLARALCGYQMIYRARTRGLHDIAIDVVPGEVYDTYGPVAAVAWIQGIPGTFRSVQVSSFRRTTIHLRRVDLRAGQGYTIVFAGDVSIRGALQATAFGQFTGAFPRITIDPLCEIPNPIEPTTKVSPEQAAGHYPSLEEMAAALNDGAGAFARAQELTPDQIAAAGDGLITSSEEGS